MEALWTVSVDSSVERCEYRVAPDGCVDLLLSEGVFRVVGPMTRGMIVTIEAGGRMTGARLRPGVAAHLFGVSPAEIADQIVSAVELPCLRAAIEGRQESCAEPAPSLTEILQTLSARAGAPPRAREIVFRAAAALAETPSYSVRALASDLGWSERHLHRRFVEQVGLRPKLFARIQRLQQFLRGVRTDGHGRSLVDLALASGYADQAHLARECRELLSETPSAVLLRMSDSFKTPPPQTD